jgi:hypothetical protein
MKGTKQKTSAKPATPADFVRAALRKGTLTDEQIRAQLKRRFPRYGATKIAVAFYRRELKQQGERLPVKAAKRAMKRAAKKAAGEAGQTPASEQVRVA